VHLSAAGHSSVSDLPEHLESSPAGFPTELGRKGAEISFFKFRLPQFAHSGSLSCPGSCRTSKTLLQSLHLYSNIGMTNPSFFVETVNLFDGRQENPPGNCIKTVVLMPYFLGSALSPLTPRFSRRQRLPLAAAL